MLIERKGFFSSQMSLFRTSGVSKLQSCILAFRFVRTMKAQASTTGEVVHLRKEQPRVTICGAVSSKTSVEIVIPTD